MILYANAAMAAVLIVAMLIELRTGRIPNWLTLVPVGIFIAVLALADDRSALLFQLGLAVALFVLGIVLFSVGAIGAGAVKLLAATTLFIPLGVAFYTFLVFLAVFFVSAFVFVQLRKLFGSEDSRWHVMAKAVIPLSFPICVAGLVGMFVL